MEIISQEEFFRLKKRGYGFGESEMGKILEKLKVGDCFHITAEEWKKIGYKCSPINIIHGLTFRKRKNYPPKFEGWKFSVRRAIDGWVGKRIK
jgi:hypothetical protein